MTRHVFIHHTGEYYIDYAGDRCCMIHSVFPCAVHPTQYTHSFMMHCFVVFISSNHCVAYISIFLILKTYDWKSREEHWVMLAVWFQIFCAVKHTHWYRHWYQLDIVRAANQCRIFVFCMDLTCEVQKYEFDLKIWNLISVSSVT